MKIGKHPFHYVAVAENESSYKEDQLWQNDDRKKWALLFSDKIGDVQTEKGAH